MLYDNKAAGGVPGINKDAVDMFDGSYIGNDDMFQPFTDPQQKTFFTNEESWNLQIGPVTLNIPPQALRVTRNYSNVAAAYVLRSKTASKLSPGRYTRVVEINLTIPRIGDVWEGQNSLRMLVTLFRSCPFLPVRQAYLNSVFNIDALSLVSLSVNTVPGLPETTSVSLICYEFNWKAYVPVKGSFWDIFDPNRFQVHLDRSVESINSYSSMPYKTERTNPALRPDGKVRTDTGLKMDNYLWEAKLESLFGPREAVRAVSDLELYYSDRNYSSELWLNKINAYEQVVDAAKIVGNWQQAVKNSFFETVLQAFMGEGTNLKDNLLEQFQTQYSSSTESTKAYSAFTALCSLSEFWLNNAGGDQQFYNAAMDKLKKLNPGASPEMLRRIAQFYVAQERMEMILGDGRIVEALKDSRVRWIPEWDIPMRRMGFLNQDLRRQIIVESVAVATQNAIMALPLAGKTTPTHQHLGNLGTSATVTLKVFGERALTYINDILDRIDLSALRNKSAGVTGFLGIENDLINVMGMRYALVDKFDVQTIPGLPHVYQVTLNLSDFDVMQQKREQPSVVERVSMMEQMSHGHPIMRSRQVLSAMNAYPDLPLPRTKISKTILYKDNLDKTYNEGTKQYANTGPSIFRTKVVDMPGQYYDPDYYFKQAVYYEGIDQKGYVDKNGDVHLTNAGNHNKRSIDGTFEKDWNHPDIDVTLQAQFDDIAPVKVSKTKNEKGINVSAEIMSNVNPAEVAEGYENIMYKKKIDRAYTEGVEQSQSLFYLSSEEGQSLSDDEKKMWEARASIYGTGQLEPTNLLHMLDDQRFRSSEGRMVKAFPTVVVYLIDEGDNVIMYRLHDTFYGLQALISAQVMVDKEAPLDTAILSFSNIYNKLSTPQWYESYLMPKFVFDMIATAQTTLQRIGGMIIDLDHMKIQTGMRVQVRFGYCSNPEALPIVFNGTIAEVSDGPVLTVVAQGDGAELSVVSAANFASKASTSGFHDWLRGRAFIEPQDLIIKYLAAYGGAWQEFVKRSSANLSNPGDIAAAAHFGVCLWDTTKFGGDAAFKAKQKRTIDRIRVHIERAGKAVAGGNNIYDTVINTLGLVPSTSVDVVKQGIENFSKLTSDFELYKRNIYPGNITGMRTFGAPPSTNGGSFLPFKQLVHSLLDRAYSPADDPSQDTDNGGVLGVGNEGNDERPAHFNTGGKTNWEIMKMCEAMMPNYILAVRPFEHRSTLFYGKQNWLYTSGVMPILEPNSVDELVVGKPSELEIAQAEASSIGDMPQQNSGIQKALTDMGGSNANNGLTDAINFRKSWTKFVFKWLSEEKPSHEIYKRTTNYRTKADFSEEWGKFLQFAMEEALVSDFLSWYIGSCRCLYIWGDKNKQNDIEKMFNWWDSEIAVERSRHYKPDAEDPISGDVVICSDDKQGLIPDVKVEDSWKWVTSLFTAWKKGLEEGKKQPAKKEVLNPIDTDGDGTSDYAATGNMQTVDSDEPNASIRKETAKVIRQAMNGGYSQTQKTFLQLDEKNLKLELEAMDAGKKSGVTITETAKNDTNSKGDGKSIYAKVDAMDAAQFAVADLFFLKAGGLEGALAASGMMDAQAIAQWAYLNDCTYYGFDMDDENKYPGKEWVEKPFDPKSDQFTEVYKNGVPREIVLTRQINRMTDNPFSKEFGEPVVEIREPFSRFHSVMSETNLVANTLYEDETNVSNVIRAFAHNGAGNDGKKELTIRADRSIPPNMVKEKVYDTGYNYDMLNFYDQANHRSMGLNALKRSLQQMYGGELVILGDGDIRPYDYLWVWDTANRINGNCEVERVTHHFGLDTGFITAIKVSPIIAIDDTFSLSIWDYLFQMTNRDAALKYAAQNKAMGFTDNSQEASERQMADRAEIARETLGVADGLTGSYKTYGIGGIMSIFGDGQLMSQATTEEEKKQKKATEQLQKEDKTQLQASLVGAGIVAGCALAVFLAIPTMGASIAIAAGALAVGLGNLALVNYMYDKKQINDLGKTIGEKLANSIEKVNFHKTMFWSTCVGLLGLGYWPGIAALFFGAKGLVNGLNYLIEEEPVRIITLMKDGEPFQAGLRGARGIINGQPGTIPILSDFLGYEVPPDLESGIWMEFGYTYDDGQMLSMARNLAEHRMAQHLIETGMRSEEIIDDGLGSARNVFSAKVVDVTDGDTIVINVDSVRDPAGIPNWKDKISIKSFNGTPVFHVRLKYIDAPETEKSYEGAARPEYGGDGCKKWLEDKIRSAGNRVTLVCNPIGYTDEYGRLLAFVVLGNEEAKFKTGRFDWFKDTVNGWMVDPSRNEFIEVESQITGQMIKMKISQFVVPLFTIPVVDRLGTTTNGPNN